MDQWPCHTMLKRIPWIIGGYRMIAYFFWKKQMSVSPNETGQLQQMEEYVGPLQELCLGDLWSLTQCCFKTVSTVVSTQTSGPTFTSYGLQIRPTAIKMI